MCIFSHIIYIPINDRNVSIQYCVLLAYTCHEAAEIEEWERKKGKPVDIKKMRKKN